MKETRSSIVTRRRRTKKNERKFLSLTKAILEGEAMGPRRCDFFLLSITNLRSISNEKLLNQDEEEYGKEYRTVAKEKNKRNHLSSCCRKSFVVKVASYVHLLSSLDEDGVIVGGCSAGGVVDCAVKLMRKPGCFCLVLLLLLLLMKVL